MQKLRVIPFGGVEEIGFNCTAIEYGDQIIIVDVGLGFPFSDQYGIDYIIPNIEYLKKNKHKIEGIIITHAHLDHIGGLPYVLKDLDFPEVYASKFSIEMIKNKLSEFDLLTKAKIREVNRDSRLHSGELEINFFGVNHSIPESMGVIVRTPAGNIVHTGDFKFDNSPVNEPVADYAKIAKIGEEGVLLLISDSTNSFKKGHSRSEVVIADSLHRIVKNAKGRIVVATFSSLVNRLYQLLKIAEIEGRRVAIAGRSMENAIKIARKINYIEVSDQIFVDPRKINSFKDENIMILATGAQGENMAALARMTRGTHPSVNIKKGDTVILSASVIPGNDMLVQAVVDDLSTRGAHVYHNADDMDLHSSGHGFQEDQKLMINLCKPKFFMPVHGYQSFLYKHGQTAVSVGVEEQNVIITKRGSVIELDQHSWKEVNKLKAMPVFVSGSGIGDIGNIVLTERQQLANYGVVVVVVHYKNKTLQALKVSTRGFVFVKSSKTLLQKIKDEAEQEIKQNLEILTDEKLLRTNIIARLTRVIFAETQRQPMILVLPVTD